MQPWRCIDIASLTGDRPRILHQRQRARSPFQPPRSCRYRRRCGSRRSHRGPAFTRSLVDGTTASSRGVAPDRPRGSFSDQCGVPRGCRAPSQRVVDEQPSLVPVSRRSSTIPTPSSVASSTWAKVDYRAISKAWASAAARPCRPRSSFSNVLHLRAVPELAQVVGRGPMAIKAGHPSRNPRRCRANNDVASTAWNRPRQWCVEEVDPAPAGRHHILVRDRESCPSRGRPDRADPAPRSRLPPKPGRRWWAGRR